jgi:4-hydroxy-3-methylbut-2-en-1-yl diphosphate reductase
MILIRSEVLGFCSGVQSAVHKVKQAVEQGRVQHLPVYTIGPLIHNEQFMDYLQEQGVSVIDDAQDAPAGIAVIRAHGIAAVQEQQFRDAGFQLIDGTCPRVLNSQRIVREYSQQSFQIVLVGDHGHGEVRAVAGAARVPEEVIVVHDPSGLEAVTFSRPLVLLSQTTFSSDRFDAVADQLVRLAEAAGCELKVIKSICPATANRQQALIELCAQVDAVIVIGGKNSSNTRRLYEAARVGTSRVWHINSREEVVPEMKMVARMGITAGASTPDWLIDEIERELTC